ncbi:hypothetical protein Trco_007481 [Trichoderma cornu-damae]|uniref:Rhodanese domain-containing protein n=1 Tax=Trichoderma cornu-damae TaxID=654480 RepID=A0A9P8QJB9_9HYPO|nr:hypothetical protein Trco_007481 [Trichoderma cornu-damae]
MASSNQVAVAPWHSVYPPPRDAALKSITREAVLQMMRDGESVAAKDFLLIDLRRIDYEGGTIRGSINLPAQSLYPTIPTLYSLFKAAGLRNIIWYCSSSRGRGSRAAGWFRDYIDERGDNDMESVVLLEGIKGWATAGSEFVNWMDKYDAAFWAK